MSVIFLLTKFIISSSVTKKLVAHLSALFSTLLSSNLSEYVFILPTLIPTLVKKCPNSSARTSICLFLSFFQRII